MPPYNKPMILAMFLAAASPEPVAQHPTIRTLLGNGGLYAPFLELALACEAGDGVALADQAGMLGLTGDQVNRAQLGALAFADAMEM